jgi:predicted GNAT superfamily acetyltransferase
MPDVTYRDLTTLADFASVVELEREIWGTGYDDVVPISILSVSVLRGGVLIGAFVGDRMVGFVYSLPGLKHGKPLQWSHMLGVVDEFRNDGLGLRLKMLQRDRSLAMGLDLIEWTFDPMQTLNAYLNFIKLGIVVDEYEINVYGKSMSPLHGGNPTDRFVAQWRIREDTFAHSTHIGAQTAANRIDRSSGQPRCVDVVLDAATPTVLVDIPAGFTEMLAKTPELALEWRLATRRIFTAYFGRGYKAMGFAFDPAAGKGTYLLLA